MLKKTDMYVSDSELECDSYMEAVTKKCINSKAVVQQARDQNKWQSEVGPIHQNIAWQTASYLF